jgi:hypothetical protein
MSCDKEKRLQQKTQQLKHSAIWQYEPQFGLLAE